MHRAKGLKFDEVVLLLPASFGQEARMENSIQLQYVAMTRAKKMVTVIRY